MKVLLCIAFIALGLTQVLGQQDPNCCTMACCVNGDEYKCNMAANTCFSGTKFTSGPKCGPGNNGIVCAKPEVKPSSGAGGGGGGGGNVKHCPSGCVIDGKCQESMQACKDKLQKLLQSAIQIGSIVVGVCVIGCICACFAFGWCCCANKKVTLANRKRGESYIEVIPEANVTETGAVYQQMK